MSYTKEEVGIIKNNLKQIEEYAKNTFLPRLREHESVCVEFGENDSRRWNFSMEKDHSFGVDADGDVWYRAGGLVLYFDPPEWRADRSIYDLWTYAKNLLLCWPQVKRQVEDALTAKERERTALLSFSATEKSETVRNQPDYITVESILHKYKMEALEEALCDCGTSVQDQLQEYLISLYSEKVPLPIQQEIRERIDGERGDNDTSRSPVPHTAKPKGRLHRGECR